jgi:hypothetical protein
MTASSKVEAALAQLQAQRGNKWRYALIRGVLLFGLPGWVLFMVIEVGSHHIDQPLKFALVIFPVWCIGGFLFGLWRWRFGLWPLRLGASIYKRFHRDG